VKRRQVLIIGTTVLVALFLLIRAILFLHPSPGDGKQKLHVRFESVEKVAPGTRVAFAGKPIGEVASVTLIPDASDRKRRSPLIYPYEVTLSLDSSVNVFKTDNIAVKTSGLMGERFIVITPKPFPPGVEGELALSSDILYAEPTTGADQAIEEISNVVQKADAIMDALSTLIKANQPTITQTATSLQEASNSLNTILQQLQERNFGERVSSLVDKATTCADEITTLARQFHCSSGDQGTVGKLITDPKLYDKAVVCLNNMTQLMTDMDSYGLFFHSNKDWQRETILRKEQLLSEQNVPISLRIRKKFTDVSDSLQDITLALKQAHVTLSEKKQTYDPLFTQEFLDQMNTVQKELDRLHSEIKDLEIGEQSTGEGS
jgi:phospholipid/cholesterol/gamma-HCH transport system substrate-binding protein